MTKRRSVKAMCRAPHYQVCSLETNRPDLPLIDFAELKLDCQMVVLSLYAASFIIVSVNNPAAGPITAIPMRGTLSVTAIDYVIYCERRDGEFESQGYRHEFNQPVPLKGLTLETKRRRLFETRDLAVLLGPQQFSCTKGIQFIA